MDPAKTTVNAQAAHEKHELDLQSRKFQEVIEIQPWKEIIDQIESETKMMPLEGDFFVCQEELHAHSLAA